VAHIVVLFNADYDDADVAPDVSSVQGVGETVAHHLRQRGQTVELDCVRGGIDAIAKLVALAQHAPHAVVFNLCESLAGSASHEPTFAGLLELLGLRYTGNDLLALALCLHKQRTKDVLRAHHVPTPAYCYLADHKAVAAAATALNALDYPWFIKLAREDASVGITEANVVHSASQLRARALALMDEFHQGVLAERYIDGREVNASLLGTFHADPDVLPLHEIDFSAMPVDRPNIVSYAAKWDEGHVDYAGTKSVPLGDADPALVETITRVTRDAWYALGLRGYARVDLRIDAAGAPWVIDVNPNPDLSHDAGFARAAAAAGMDYGALVARIAELASLLPSRLPQAP
jgi:D-alanine-D-alanine ligase